jgi:hypothetical protein
MESRNRIRRIACIATPVIALGVVALVSCREAGITDDARMTRSATIDPRIPSSPGESSVAQSMLRSRNRSTWVGDAHNRIIDNFRNEMRKPGVLSNKMCGFIPHFVVQQANIAPPTPAVLAQIKSLARRSVSPVLCKNASHSDDAALSPGEVSSPPSAQAEQLFSEVEAAAMAANNSSELASRLLPILESAASLDSIDHAAISITIAVAQSSFEYWEANYSPLVQDVVSEYGSCLAEQSDVGSTIDEVRDSCVAGKDGEYETHWSIPRHSRAPVMRFTTWKTSRGCPSNPSEGLKYIGLADLAGAFRGFYTGAFAGNPVGGAIVGAGAASVTVGLGMALRQAWCIMWAQ